MKHTIVGALFALAVATAFAQDVVTPNANLLADGIPAGEAPPATACADSGSPAGAADSAFNRLGSRSCGRA